MIRIAIVEDEIEVAEGYNEWLTAHDADYVTTYFPTRAAAVSEFAKTHYDLILLDIQLGRHDLSTGFGVMKDLGMNRSTPVIVVSGAEPSELFKSMINTLDIWDYLPKPVDPSSLISVVNSALRAVSRMPPLSPKEKKVEEPGTELDPRLIIDLANARYPTWNKNVC